MVDNYLKPVFLQTSGNDLRLTEIYLSLDIKGTTHRYIIIIIVMLRADKTIYTETIKKIDIKIIKEKIHVKNLSVNHVKDPSTLN